MMIRLVTVGLLVLGCAAQSVAQRSLPYVGDRARFARSLSELKQRGRRDGDVLLYKGQQYTYRATGRSQIDAALLRGDGGHYVPGLKSDDYLELTDKRSADSIVFGVPIDGSDARAAILAMDATGVPLRLRAGTYSIQSDLTLAGQVVFDAGARLQPASGVTINLDGGYIASPRQHVFDISAGGNVRSQSSSMGLCHFGADFSGAVSCNTIFLRAMECCRDSDSVLAIERGTYTLDYSTDVNSTRVILGADQSLRIVGNGQPVLKIADGGLVSDFARLINVYSPTVGEADTVSIKGVSFDFNARGNPYGVDHTAVFVGDRGATTDYKLGDRVRNRNTFTPASAWPAGVLVGQIYRTSGAFAAGDLSLPTKTRIRALVDGASEPASQSDFDAAWEIVEYEEVYVCTVAGTTSSGAGPASRADNIVDGSVQWSWVGAHHDPDKWEHTGAVFIAATNSGKIRRVEIDDCHLIDRAAFDGFVAYTPGGDAAIGSFSVRNSSTISVSDPEPMTRPDVLWYAGVDRVSVSNCDFRRIETEYLSEPINAQRADISHCRIEELDIGGDLLADVHVADCYIRSFLLWGHSSGSVKNTHIANLGLSSAANELIELSVWNRPRPKFEFVGNTMDFYVTEAGTAFQSIVIGYPSAADADIFDTEIRIEDNTFVQMGRHPSLANWSASASVRWGERRVAGGNIYRAKQAGTTGNVEPVGNGDWIADGGVRWDYVGPVSDDCTSGRLISASLYPASRTKRAITTFRRNKFLHQGGSFFNLLIVGGEWLIQDNLFSCSNIAGEVNGSDGGTAYVRKSKWSGNDFSGCTGPFNVSIEDYQTAQPSARHEFAGVFEASATLTRAEQSYVTNSATTQYIISSRVITGDGAPVVTAGWLAGDTYIDRNAQPHEVDRYVVKSAARTGLNATLQAVPSRTLVGTTANRPTLSSNDVGVQYLDPDLSALMCWTGSGWLETSTEVSP